MAQIDDAFRVSNGISLDDEILIYRTVTDPNSGGGIEAPVGSFLLQKPSSGEGQFWKKYDTGNTDWKKIATKAYESSGDPTADNDDVDTAGEGVTFDRGDIWVNTTDDGVFICKDNTSTSAVWYEFGTGTDVDAIHDNVASEINAITEKSSPVNADIFIIEDSADSYNKKKVQMQNIEATDPDAIHDNVSSEISAITEKTAPVPADLFVIEDSAASNAKKRLKLANLKPFPTYHYFAYNLDTPNSSDWTINTRAPATADPTNNGLIVREFDDSAEEGVGLKVFIPSGATNIIFGFKGRAQTAPGATAGVSIDMYHRGIPDNAAVASWSAAQEIIEIDIPTNAYFQYDEATISLSTLGITANRLYQFEFTRDYDDAHDDLTGNWLMIELTLSFS